MFYQLDFLTVVVYIYIQMNKFNSHNKTVATATSCIGLAIITLKKAFIHLLI
jgi:hypothetical protein